MEPIIIRKSMVGFVLINLIGLLLFAGLAYAAIASGLMTHRPIAAVYATASAFVALGTMLQGYVYKSSYVQITNDRLIVTNYSSLLVANTDQLLFNDVQDVNYTKPGILAMMFDTGTILVNSASGQQLLKLTWIPDPERWTIYLIQQAKRAQSKKPIAALA